jgi:ribosomal protein L37AE/L43A
MPSNDSITHWECPKCGRVGASGHGHAPPWTSAFEHRPQPCDGEPIQRTYVAVDAIGQLFERIRDEGAPWINLSDDDLHAAIDMAHDRGDTRMVGLISYELGRRAGRAAEREGVVDLAAIPLAERRCDQCSARVDEQSLIEIEGAWICPDCDPCNAEVEDEEDEQ